MPSTRSGNEAERGSTATCGIRGLPAARRCAGTLTLTLSRKRERGQEAKRAVRALAGRGRFEHGVVELRVREHARHIVEVLEAVEEAQRGDRVLLLEVHLLLRHLRHLGVLHREAGA